MPIPKVLHSLRSTSCPAFATDGKGVVLDLNGPAEVLPGFTSASVRGRRCQEVFAGRDQFNNLFCLENCAVREMAARSEAVNPFDLCLRTACGAMLGVSMSVVALRDGGRKRPAILHLFRPVEPTVEEKSRYGDGLPFVREPGASASSRLLSSRHGFGGLTPREPEILALLAAGRSCHDISLATGIGLVTVRNHFKRIYPKLRVHSQAEAVSFAFRNNLIRGDGTSCNLRREAPRIPSSTRTSGPI